MPISDFADMMTATVTYAKVATRDDYGKPATFCPAVSYKAHITHARKRMGSQAPGQDVISDAQVHINGLVTGPNVDDRLTLDDGTTPPIISWDLRTDETGAQYQKFYLGAV